LNLIVKKQFLALANLSVGFYILKLFNKKQLIH